MSKFKTCQHCGSEFLLLKETQIRKYVSQVNLDGTVDNRDEQDWEVINPVSNGPIECATCGKIAIPKKENNVKW